MDKKKIVLDYLENCLRDGTYKLNDKVISEIDLTKKFGISRVIVREAFASLTQQGVLEKIVGSGTYVRDLSNYVKKTYIIITTEESSIMSQTASQFKIIIEKLKKYITDAGYTPYLYLENESITENDDLTNYINIPIDEIAGIISLRGHNKKYETYKENNIPIVTVFNAISTVYPGVNSDYKSFYQSIIDLIKKHNFKNVMILQYIFSNLDLHKLHTEQMFHYGISEYFKKQYNVKEIPFSVNFSDTSREFEKIMSEIQDTPDAIIILDNNIYMSSYHLFPKYKNILKNTKIISQSNQCEIYTKDFNICKITFNIDEFAQKAMKLLLEMIDNKLINQPIINIQPKIENEDALKN